jgi:hypothetical protein
LDPKAWLGMWKIENIKYSNHTTHENTSKLNTQKHVFLKQLHFQIHSRWELDRARGFLYHARGAS